MSMAERDCRAPAERIKERPCDPALHRPSSNRNSAERRAGDARGRGTISNRAIPALLRASGADPMFKQLSRVSALQEAIGFSLAAYIRLVRRTNRFEQPDLEALVDGRLPVIVAMWHGQHFMIPYARPKSLPSMAALISRHGD